MIRTFLGLFFRAENRPAKPREYARLGAIRSDKWLGQTECVRMALRF